MQRNSINLYCCGKVSVKMNGTYKPCNFKMVFNPFFLNIPGAVIYF